MFVPRNVYIPASNWYWLEWKKVIVPTTLAIFGLLAWCAIGEYLLP